MNSLSLKAEITMSSREIAELTGKRHGHVKVDIENMLTELGEDMPKFRHIYLDSMNRKQVEYLLDRRLTDCLVTGYSAVLRIKVIDRWHELEQTAKTPSPIGHTLNDFLREDMSQIKLQLNEVQAKQNEQGKVLELILSKDPLAKRKDFNAATKQAWLITIDRCYGGMCPSGNGTRIADRDENGIPHWIKSAYELDHWFQRDRNKKTEGWPLSKQAHKDKTTKGKDGFHGKFETFQNYLKDTVIPKGVKPKDDNNVYSLFPA